MVTCTVTGHRALAVTHAWVCWHTCARHFGRLERPGPWDGCGQAPAAALPAALLPPGFCGPASEMGAPPGLLPAPERDDLQHYKIKAPKP